MPATLSLVTILWSAIAAGALLLGLIHLGRWLLDRQVRGDLAFVVTVVGFVGIALTELWGMHAQTPDAWSLAVRWCHPGIALLTFGLVWYVHLHLGTDRAWLAIATVGLRAVILAWNFAVWPNFNFERVESVANIPFLGQGVTVVGDAVTSRWQFLGVIESLLLALYVLDAAVTAWRTGDAEKRRRAVVIGGAMLLFTVLASAYAQLVIFGILQVPLLITPTFIVPLAAMAYELSRELLRAPRLARELHDSRLSLELAAGSANLGLWEWDGRRGRILATRRAREIFGLLNEECGDYRRWLAIVHPDDVERLVDDLSRAIESGEEYATEFRIRPDGQGSRWVSIRGRAERSQPGFVSLVRGVLRDVTEQRLAKDETQELRRELAHAGRVSMLGQLSSSLAHEISQPLGAIQRNAEAAGMLLESSNPDHGELKEIVADILRDDRRAREVIDRLRTMLKRRTGETVPVATDSLVEDVISIVRADASSRGISLEHESAPGLPDVVGDRVQLSQVLLNLVLNAMDAVAGQSAGRRRVALQSRRGPDDRIEISVSDSGTGIAADQARRIFEPFFTTKESGMGLGLAISRTIAESHGGTLVAEGNDQGGATFRFSLPARGSAPP